MRITQAYAFENSIGSLQKRQQALSEAQEQLTSGKRVRKASDDPAAAATAERALAAQSRAEAQMRALDTSKNAMQLTESALGTAGELMQQARELLVSAGNGSYSDSERATIALAIRGLRDELLAVANRGDGAGRYLFGGQGADGPPLLDGPGGVAYNAAAGQTQAALGEPSPLAIDGRAAWLQAASAATPGSTDSLFDVMDRVVGELLTPGRTGAQIGQGVADGLRDFDAVSENLASWRSRSGEALNRIERIGERLSQSKLDAQTERSNAEDLDMIQAISDFQNRQSGYDAALKTYSMVQQMSLLQYLR
jgi:flagellar hook-associated protein 3 FlgL